VNVRACPCMSVSAHQILPSLRSLSYGGSTKSIKPPPNQAQSSPIKPNRAIFPCFDMTTNQKTAKSRNCQLPGSVLSDRSGRSDLFPQFALSSVALAKEETCRAGLSSATLAQEEAPRRRKHCGSRSEAKSGLPRRSEAKAGHLLQRYSFTQMKPNKGQ
jgi:hypothetical protein